MKKNFWTIDGINEIFESLSDAKWHVEIAFTPSERMKYLRNTNINHIVNGECVSTVSVKINDNGKFGFGKIVKL